MLRLSRMKRSYSAISKKNPPPAPKKGPRNKRSQVSQLYINKNNNDNNNVMPEILLPPPAPKKGLRKGISPSSEYYINNNNNNNNLSPENLNATPVNLEELMRKVKEYPGNGPLPFSHKNLNYAVPKLKLPAYLQGGRSTRKRTKKSRKTYKKSRSH